MLVKCVIVQGEEIKRLYERIKKLILRNEQLCSLLKDAGIKVPSECGNVKNFKKAKPWSNRITPEQAKLLAEKENQSKYFFKLNTKNICIEFNFQKKPI